jgi:iron complex outermembrane receptor protein
VVAGRFDKGDLFDGQFSPKGALVYSPNERHSLRVTVNRAFQTPNYSELFLRAGAGRPANLSALEAGLRASPLGPALAGVPSGTLFTTSPAVPVLALGNGNLTVERVTGFEAGYKGNLSSKLYVEVDVYHNRLSNFVTDLLPGVNPSFGSWTSPTQVPTQFRAPLEAAVRQQLLAANQPIAANGLTRLANGSTAIVLSYANAGKVKEQGVEFAAGYLLTDEVRVEGSYTFFDFDAPEGTAAGDKVLPNTPKHKGTLSVQYAGAQGLDLGVTVRRQTAFEWAAGVFSGFVDWSQTVNLNAGYQVGNNLRVHAIATNVLDQKRFHIYGGSVIGRRVIAGVTATF